MFRSLTVVLPALVAVGCSCNQDPDFANQKDPLQGDEPADYGAWLSMDTAPDGVRLTIAFYDREFGAVGFAVGEPKKNGVDWAFERVHGYPASDGLDPGDFGIYTTHAVSPDGTVWAAWSKVGATGLWVSQRLGGVNSWTEAEEVDTDGGLWADLAVTADGVPVISHATADGKLRVTRRTSEGTWSTDEPYSSSDFDLPADTAGNVDIREASVTHTRIVIDDGAEHVAFFDAAEMSLFLLEGTEGSYSETLVDSEGDVGAWPSIWVDGGEMKIAYHDVGNQTLKLATRSGGAFATETIDDGDFRGADTEIYSVAGVASVLYFDGYNNDMRLATNDGGWTLSNVGGSGEAVGFHNEVAKAGDSWWAASYNYTTRKLFVTKIGS